MIRKINIALVLLLSAMMNPDARAHESQPGILEMRQVTHDRFEVIWRAPIYYGRPHPARLALPDDWRIVVEPTAQWLPDSQVFRQVVVIDADGMEGDVVRFPGLENTITEVFVKVNRIDGSTITATARPTRAYALLRGERSWVAAAGEYISIGYHHILKGVDHLLFILGLMLIVKRRMMLFKTITSFTAAHSITLGLATLGYATAPLPPLNAAIALSILFLGPEIVRSWRGETSLTIQYPWVVAFLFGLLHGFGFASGLSTAGMPKGEIPIALLFFNVGVELGQLGFVVLILMLLHALRKLEFRWPRWIETLPGYVVGSLGASWTIQRVAIMFGV